MILMSEVSPHGGVRGAESEREPFGEMDELWERRILSCDMERHTEV